MMMSRCRDVAFLRACQINSGRRYRRGQRPQDVVREVMQKTGINRTTAQRMTATLRRAMRLQRRFAR
jgi:hypothetical protein